MALAISAIVLVASATAIDASFRSYSINQEQSDQLQKARIAMFRITTQIRTTAAQQPISNGCKNAFNSGVMTTDTGISMIDVNGKTWTYSYDSVNSQVVCTDGSGHTYPVVRGVQQFTVKFEPLLSGSTNSYVCMRGTILITVNTSGSSHDIMGSVAGQSVTLSTSVMPRQNIY
jgi:hypothetical protein